jgi:hypothetical protein
VATFASGNDLDGTARAVILAFLGRQDDVVAIDSMIPSHILTALRTMGFVGSGDAPIRTRNGFFYSRDALECSPFDETVEIWDSTTLRWMFGAPGIAVRQVGESTKCYVPGVFVGSVPGIDGEGSLRIEDI